MAPIQVVSHLGMMIIIICTYDDKPLTLILNLSRLNPKNTLPPPGLSDDDYHDPIAVIKAGLT